MKIAHWSLSNGSGLNRVAFNICDAEKELGHNSIFIPTDKLIDGKLDKKEWENGMDADVHVVHSTLPDELRKTKGKIVFIPHGTPEVCFQTASDGKTTGAWGLSFYWLKSADAIVTFWPRHQYVWKSLCQKNTIVDCIPMGINKEFWKPVTSRGKYDGEPSVMTSENSHQIKWCYDVALAWPEVSKSIPASRLHLFYIPTNQIPAFFPLFYNNGLVYSSYISSFRLGNEDLRNAFVSVDYYISPVMYGDFNAVCLEAKASGCKIISYAGNEYADYWLVSQDQRMIASELIEILSGNRPPRADALSVVDTSETAKSMISIYERILSGAQTLSITNPIKIKADNLKSLIAEEFGGNGNNPEIKTLAGIQAK